MNKKCTKFLIQEIFTEKINLFSKDVISYNRYIRLHIDSNQYISSEKHLQISPHLQVHSKDKRVDYSLEIPFANLSKSLNDRQVSVMTSTKAPTVQMFKKTDRETVFCDDMNFR